MATDNKSKQKTKSNNKNRQRYRPNNKSVKKGAYPLRPGVQGFYITCDGGRERQASQEAVNVIDSFYEELVQGTNSNLGQVELSEKPVNKKTVFKYSDSSSSDDDDEDEENGNGEDQTKEETSKIEQHQEKTDDEIDSLKTGASEPENKDNTSTDELIQGNTENKEELENTLEQKDIEVGEPPAKKQCVEKEAAEAGNIAFGKTEEKSIDRLIDAELAELGDKSKRRFSYLDTGCNGVVFVHMSKKDGDPNPKEIVQHMLSSLALTKKHVSRFILRVLPVEVTCYASEEEIGKAITPLITKYLPAESDTPKKFAVLYESRANTGINKMKIIDAVAKSVPSPHKVDLSNPEINIVVQIVKTVCLLGVVEKYKELSKYNLRQLTSKN
ncbi:THUMP domain-containing protein 1 homolog [Solanum pennellii]|uniref:THUMP domain-containing protein 1 homolog n=1 Tax=Solanum pennellii TaxID=28526 RepID=A0ABM1FMU5_SOLPN|nr:THUMP domain-containing protein 1 homolog [Solanum pennellii]